MMFIRSLADFNGTPWAVQVTVGAITVTAQATSSPDRHDTQGSGDFYLATNGDINLATNGDLQLATNGDFHLATDKLHQQYMGYDSREVRLTPLGARVRHIDRLEASKLPIEVYRDPATCLNQTKYPRF